MKWETESHTHRLIPITDDVWVSPYDVIALERHFDGTRIHLRHNHPVHIKLAPTIVIERLKDGIRKVQQQ